MKKIQNTKKKKKEQPADRLKNILVTFIRPTVLCKKIQEYLTLCLVCSQPTIDHHQEKKRSTTTIKCPKANDYCSQRCRTNDITLHLLLNPKLKGCRCNTLVPQKNKTKRDIRFINEVFSVYHPSHHTHFRQNLSLRLPSCQVPFWICSCIVCSSLWESCRQNEYCIRPFYNFFAFFQKKVWGKWTKPNSFNSSSLQTFRFSLNKFWEFWITLDYETSHCRLEHLTGIWSILKTFVELRSKFVLLL